MSSGWMAELAHSYEHTQGTQEICEKSTSAAQKEFSEKRTGNIAKRRLLVNPSGPEFQTEFCYFIGENDLIRNKEEFTNPLPTAMFAILLLLSHSAKPFL